MSPQSQSSLEQELTQEVVLQYLEDAREGAMEAKQYSTAIRAAELMGKHLGMFGKKEEQPGPMEIRWAGEDL
ncbi:hypothetical protein [Desulfatibacillum aliphaticivorans]|uniref:Uncharacterized protein n=1 Tax=Desulfatibacillum aliphaticivorans TaxID=218208 RepID=B8FJI4_DESAL|nr:hypothetical protein [Desulfatibacillum aliphaticivorans]ACL05653.1 hypothetical protein Dalk_3967 [Desulfatibacillum aliphaticivorans]